MKRLILTSLVVAGTSFAEPMLPQPQAPTPSQPQTMPSQPQPLSATQMPQPMPLSSMPPIEIKPEDRAIINLKKKMVVKQTYNDYQKVDKATSIDRVNLERSLREARYALKAQMYKEKQIDSQLPHPYYYSIPIAGVVGDVALTSQTSLKDGTVLKDKDKIVIKDGLVYIKDYLISYPVMDNIRHPKVDADTLSSSVPQLLTGLPVSNPSTGSPSVSLPPPPPPPPPPSPPPSPK